MNSVSILAFLVNLLIVPNFSGEVEIKSMVSQDETRVYVDIVLPSDSNVSFSLADESGALKHHWRNQVLSSGRHQLALPVPIIAQGKYLLLIMVEDEPYEQMVFLSGS